MRRENKLVRTLRTSLPPYRLTALLLLAACNPNTSRPAFLPYPEAPVAVLDAPRERIVPQVTAWLEAESVRVRRSEPRDGYVETAWYDPVTRRSFATEGDVPHLERVFRIRCWTDPDIPGASRLTVEAVYRPVYDPSRPRRDLEVLAPEGHEGRKVAMRLIEAMKAKFGAPPGRS